MYERLGFKLAGKIDGYYEDGEEATVYSLKLS
jgi:ribosomal protein S18 acetylase RimI-like enzyme